MTLTTLIILAVALWIVYTHAIPAMPEPVRGVVSIVVGIIVIAYLLQVAGINVL